MKLWSNSWPDGGRIPARHAAGRIDGSVVGFSDNVNPHLAWSEAPVETKSFALIVHDPDVPSRGDDVNQPDREVSTELPRVDFFHWLLVDLPATRSEIAEGEFSQGFTARGKDGPDSLDGTRQGLNDYTGWFAGDADRAGHYFGYDGPFPPFNDARVHRYLFTLCALGVARAPVDGQFTGAALRAAIAPHVLASATWSGSYTLNRRLAV